MAVDYEFKDSYTVEDLIQIVKLLRSPGGCPWDREQNHTSIRGDLIEETYEVIEAINKQDTELLKEELGDVMLHVVFHSVIEEEKGSFNLNDVADGVCKKMIVRHPHVFGDVTVSGTGEVLSNWEEIKRKTKHQKTVAQSMDGVPRELPALMRSCKLQYKAQKAGADIEKEEALRMVAEKARELNEGVTRERIGELIFAAVAAARQEGIDPEEALTAAADSFIDRFTKAEAKGDKISPDALYNKDQM